MPSIFKYMRAEHLDRALSAGRFRIGTLYEYRNIENHGSEVGDADEGRRSTALNTAGTGFVVKRSDDSEKARFFKQMLGSKMPRSITVTDDAKPFKFLGNEQSEDVFVFSAASGFSAAAMREFNYDACIEIIDPAGFFDAISRSLVGRAEFRGYGAVTYINREADYRAPHKIHPALLKDPRYEYQREVRAMWSSTGVALKPIIEDFAEAAQYCREHRVLDA